MLLTNIFLYIKLDSFKLFIIFLKICLTDIYNYDILITTTKQKAAGTLPTNTDGTQQNERQEVLYYEKDKQ